MAIIWIFEYIRVTLRQHHSFQICSLLLLYMTSDTRKKTLVAICNICCQEAPFWYPCLQSIVAMGNIWCRTVENEKYNSTVATILITNNTTQEKIAWVELGKEQVGLPWFFFGFDQSLKTWFCLLARNSQQRGIFAKLIIQWQLL